MNTEVDVLLALGSLVCVCILILTVWVMDLSSRLKILEDKCKDDCSENNEKTPISQ